MTDASKGRSARYEHVERFLRQFARAEDIVLETGCGSAPYRDLFRRGRYWGTDVINPHYRRPGDVDVFCSAEALPFRDGVFGLMFSQAAIDYVPDIHAALAEAHRVLRPGGRMLIFTYRRSTLRRIHRQSQVHRDAVRIHRHVFAIAELTRWLQAAGFAVTRLPMPGSWLDRLRSHWRIVLAEKPAARAVA
jgi:SAM-dependent methyltransferase